MFNRAASVALCAVLASAGSVFGSAIITVAPVLGATNSDFPGYASVVNYTTPGISYGVGAGTTFNTVLNTYDLRDLFGARFTQSQTGEEGRVVFGDRAAGTADVVFINTPFAFAMSEFKVMLAADGPFSNTRSTRAFRVFDNLSNALIADALLLTPGTSYTSLYGSNIVTVTGVITGAPVTSSYRLEFVNNAGSGVRAMEFAAQAVPEPGTAGLVLAAASMLVMRRRR